MRREGLVVWFSPEKSYGSIYADGQTYFVGRNQIEPDGRGLQYLLVNEPVSFAAAFARDRNKWIATNVTPLFRSCGDVDESYRETGKIIVWRQDRGLIERPFANTKPLAFSLNDVVTYGSPGVGVQVYYGIARQHQKLKAVTVEICRS
jgi:cold shock CspA family protein